MFFATVPKTQVPFGFHQRMYSVSFVTDYQLFNFLFIRYHFKVYSRYYIVKELTHTPSVPIYLSSEGLGM
jgi:hypothetical protein